MDSEIKIKFILLYKYKIFIEKEFIYYKTFNKTTIDIINEIVIKYFGFDIMKYSISEVTIKENEVFLHIKEEDFVKIRQDKIDKILN
jgi:hypothetical protein